MTGDALLVALVAELSRALGGQPDGVVGVELTWRGERVSVTVERESDEPARE